MWPLFYKLGIAAVLGVGLGLVLLLNQESAPREIHYHRNWRESEHEDVPVRRPPNSENRNRRRAQKSKRKDEKNQRQMLEDQLNSGTAECVICTENISYSDAVWSCNYCWNIFHLHCIKKWVNIDAGRSHWNCPVCRTTMNTSSDCLRYLCMCGRKESPKAVPGVTPHCCGQKCWRGCGNRCHPGPCSIVDSE